MTDASLRIRVGNVVWGLDQQVDWTVTTAEVFMKVGGDWSAGLGRGGSGKSRLHRLHDPQRVRREAAVW